MSFQQPLETPTPQDSRRAQRAERILDAAAALILRWGYNKTTIDDIARQAGVAKGTIYLHWKTREELFTALMLRERLALTEDFRTRLQDDPTAATLRGMLKHSALALMQRPLLKAALLRDSEIIGKLAQRQESVDLLRERLLGFSTYLEFLREHDLVRTDLDLRAQVYLLGAVFTGFFLLAPLMPEGWRLADAELAELMAETVHRALDPEQLVAPDTLAAAGQAFLRYVERDIALAQAALQNTGGPRPEGEDVS